MGSGCTKRYDNKILRSKSGLPINISSQQYIKIKKNKLFLNEASESSFYQLSTPRSGKSIRWKKGQLLGQGAYAKVYQCMNIQTGALLAVKQFRLLQDLTRIQKVFTNMRLEVTFLKSLDHPNIVKYYQSDLAQDMSTINVILQFVPGGSLKEIISKYGALQQKAIRHYTRQLIRGLTYLHQRQIAHRDLKSANVLVTTEGVVKLTDLGSSRMFQQRSISRSLKGSPYWMAPEVVLRQGHSLPADVWSFGCLLLEMASGRPPWSDLSKQTKEVMQFIADKKMKPTFPKCSRELQQVIESCLQRNPRDRPQAVDLAKFDFFNVNIDQDQRGQS